MYYVISVVSSMTMLVRVKSTTMQQHVGNVL